MMQRTDRHFRVLMRRVTRHTLLYTEMVTANAIIHGDRRILLDFDEVEHPVALQLGGDDPTRMTEAARIGVDHGYDELNINIGCPSNRVKNGCFGASLMRRPERVAELVASMRAAVKVPVTVKHRIGVDELDRYEDMARFVEIVSQSGHEPFGAGANDDGAFVGVHSTRGHKGHLDVFGPPVKHPPGAESADDKRDVARESMVRQDKVIVGSVLPPRAVARRPTRPAMRYSVAD